MLLEELKTENLPDGLIRKVNFSDSNPHKQYVKIIFDNYSDTIVISWGEIRKQTQAGLINWSGNNKSNNFEESYICYLGIPTDLLVYTSIKNRPCYIKYFQSETYDGTNWKTIHRISCKTGAKGIR